MGPGSRCTRVRSSHSFVLIPLNTWREAKVNIAFATHRPMQVHFFFVLLSSFLDRHTMIMDSLRYKILCLSLGASWRAVPSSFASVMDVSRHPPRMRMVLVSLTRRQVCKLFLRFKQETRLATIERQVEIPLLLPLDTRSRPRSCHPTRTLRCSPSVAHAANCHA